MRILKIIRNFGNINKDYYKYALIEIVLIISGILIALSVNNANEERKFRKEEKKLLLSFHNELSSSLLNLNFVVEKKREIIDVGNEFLKYTGPNGKWESEKNFDSLLVYSNFSGWRHVPQEGVLNEIIYSGKLSIITDTNLKVLISSLPKTFSQIFEQDQALRTGVWQYWNPFFNKIAPVRNSTNYIDFTEYSKLSLGFSSFKYDYNSILRNKEFENLISMQSSYLKFNIEMLEKLKIKYLEMQKLIESKYTDVDYKELLLNIDRGVWN